MRRFYVVRLNAILSLLFEQKITKIIQVGTYLMFSRAFKLCILRLLSADLAETEDQY